MGWGGGGRWGSGLREGGGAKCEGTQSHKHDGLPEKKKPFDTPDGALRQRGRLAVNLFGASGAGLDFFIMRADRRINFIYNQKLRLKQERSAKSAQLSTQ